MGKEPLDDDLVQKAAAGCESAFKALLVASYDNIYRMAWRWVGSRAEAEAGRRTCHKRPQRLCEIVVGEKGKVTGMVAGQQVVIRGLEPSSSTPEDEVIGQDLWREVRALPPQLPWTTFARGGARCRTGVARSSSVAGQRAGRLKRSRSMLPSSRAARHPRTR